MIKRIIFTEVDEILETIVGMISIPHIYIWLKFSHFCAEDGGPTCAPHRSWGRLRWFATTRVGHGAPSEPNVGIWWRRCGVCKAKNYEKPPDFLQKKWKLTWFPEKVAVFWDKVCDLRRFMVPRSTKTIYGRAQDLEESLEPAMAKWNWWNLPVVIVPFCGRQSDGRGVNSQMRVMLRPFCPDHPQ